VFTNARGGISGVERHPDLGVLSLLLPNL